MNALRARAGEVAVRGGALLVGVALLGLAMWLRDLRPHIEAAELDPIRTEGRIGQVVSTPAFVVKVDRVDVARTLVPEGALLSRGAELGTDGIFVIVRMEGAAVRKPVDLASPKLETRDGRSYDSGPRRNVQGLFGPTVQPMIWAPRTFVFELPRSELAGAKLVIGTSGLLSQLGAEAAVDLGIDSRRAADLIRRAPRGYPVGSG